LCKADYQNIRGLINVSNTRHIVHFRVRKIQPLFV
jgi:hypothetical protein